MSANKVMQEPDVSATELMSESVTTLKRIALTAGAVLIVTAFISPILAIGVAILWALVDKTSLFVFLMMAFQLSIRIAVWGLVLAVILGVIGAGVWAYELNGNIGLFWFFFGVMVLLQIVHDVFEARQNRGR